MWSRDTKRVVSWGGSAGVLKCGLVRTASTLVMPVTMSARVGGGHERITPKGMISMVVPNQWLRSASASSMYLDYLRQLACFYEVGFLQV
jgi:hypothetical protein